MNANKRVKYAATPTYGMQKRGFAKMMASPPQEETPDFTQMPMPEMPSMQNPQQAAAFFYPSATGIPQAWAPQQQNMLYGMQQTTFSGMPLSQAAPYGMPAYQQPLPLANISSFPTSGAGGFPSRQQGYVPPTAAPASQAMPGMAPYGQPLSYGGIMPQMQPQSYMAPNYQASPQAPMVQASAPQSMAAGIAPGLAGLNPTTGASMQPPLQNAPPSSPPADTSGQQENVHPPFTSKLLMAFLLGLLPLLFIPCMFVPTTMDYLRYGFVILAVMSLGLMWYRRVFSPSTRVTISILYTALSAVLIFMLLSGGKDTQLPAAPPEGQQAAVQATEDPSGQTDPAALAAAVLEAAPETPAPPVASGESPAELRLKIFMDYWANTQYESMVQLIQPSWTSVRENASEELFRVLANRRPESYELEGITGSENDTSRTITMSAYINKNNGKDPVRYRFMILMVKEADQWYVNPNTLATNDVEEEPESTDPNAPTTIGLATAAPRTTVTPVPAPSTKLYYNPNGGKYYHADHYCESVKEEYLPLGANFLYSDLGNKPYSEMLPCLKCGAPTDPLDEANP